MKNIDKSQDTDKKSKQRGLVSLFKRHKILFFLFLFFALGTNTYAWFVFNRIVSIDITGHVKAWKISLGEDGNEWNVELNNIYPGMTSVHEEETLSNGGEMNATVNLNVLEYTLFGKTYTSMMTQEEADAITDRDITVMTREELYNTLNTYYPFEISIDSNASTIGSGEDITISVDCVWPLEGTRTDPDKTMTVNEWDTYWGNQAYEFYKANGSSATALKITVEIKAEQS